MKNYKNIFTLLVAALVGLSLTGCSDDDLDTNPYSKSGVNIVGFGPSPILRTHEIRITGTNLNKVTGVAFPGNAVVERAAFNSSDADNIYVNVPDESVPGKIRLMAGSDTLATSTSLLTFEEPIEVTAVTPTTGISAGDEISIKGEYVYNIAEVVFASGASGAPVAAEEFTYVSRKEIRLRVPLAAESGVLTLNDGADWELEYKTPLSINTAAYTALSTVLSDFGAEITIKGENLHTVETVMFPGGVTADFTVSSDHKAITTTVPGETKSGVINLVLYSGASLTTDELSVPTLAITEVSKTKDLKVGDQIVITGENLDRIKSVTLPGVGEFKDYVVSGNTLTFTVPEGMTDGKMELVQNSFITVTQAFMMYSELPETVIWAGSVTIGNWDGAMSDLSWGGYDWSTVSAGQTLYIYLTPDLSNGWSQIRVANGSWAALPGTADVNDLTAEDTKFSVTLTQEMINELVNNGGLVLCGAFFTVTKVTLSTAETTLWKGSIGPTNWSGDVTIEMTPDILGQLEVGKTMGIDFECPADAGYWQIEICGSWWTGLEGPKLVYGTNDEGRAIMDFSQDATNFEWKLVQQDIDILTQQGAMLFVGNGAIIKRLYIK